MASTRGRLVVFEGLDQSGKQTQTAMLKAALETTGLQVDTYDFPDYATPIGREIGESLRGARTFPPDALQLLYVANRCEHRPAIERALNEGRWVICDRYLASSVAYGEAQMLDPVWLFDIQRVLPAADLTVLLDLAADVAAARKLAERDRFEQDLDLLRRVRASYLRQATADGWFVVDAARDRDDVARDVRALISHRLDLPLLHL